MSKLLMVTYSLFAYVCFLVAIVAGILFLVGGIDKGQTDHPLTALALDLGLLGLFAAQHTVMARAGFKRWLTRVVPPAIERSTFVLMASVILIALFSLWRPLPARIWHVDWPPAAGALWAMYASGWLIVFASTFMVHHLDLFGLRQVFNHVRARQNPSVEFKERWLYAWVRHPMMSGLVIAFWATPTMTVGHLLFAAASTGYIVSGTLLFEERDLKRNLGPVYMDYASRVPAFVPMHRRPMTTGAVSGVVTPPQRLPSLPPPPA